MVHKTMMDGNQKISLVVMMCLLVLFCIYSLSFNYFVLAPHSLLSWSVVLLSFYFLRPLRQVYTSIIFLGGYQLSYGCILFFVAVKVKAIFFIIFIVLTITRAQQVIYALSFFY